MKAYDNLIKDSITTRSFDIEEDGYFCGATLIIGKIKSGIYRGEWEARILSGDYGRDWISDSTYASKESVEDAHRWVTGEVEIDSIYNGDFKEVI